MGSWLLDLLLTFGISGIFVTGLLIFLFKNPDKFEHWMAIFYQALYYLFSSFPKLKRKLDRYAVASSIQDTVNGACEQVNRESPGAFPHAIRVDWVKSESKDSFISNGQVVVRLKHFPNQDRNIVDSTLLYLKVGFLPRARHYLDSSLQRSCEFKVALYIFSLRRDSGAYDYFYENELRPALKSDPSLVFDLQLVDDLDSVGYFTRVFLSEIRYAGEKLIGSTSTPALQKELRDFASFLQTIATKGRNQNVPLSFKGGKIKAAVILVARPTTILPYGTEPYINRISRCVREGYESIYIAAWGSEYAKSVIEIKNDLRNLSVQLLRRHEYQLRNQTKGILLVCQSDLSYLAKQKELHQEVRKAMSDVVPEIASGEVEIVDIARIKNVGCKVAVRSVSEENSPSAVGTCIGVNSDRLSALRARIGKEFVGIVGWSENTQQFLINALVPLKASDVERVEIDEENLTARIIVRSDDSYRKALGKNNFNVKLATELTGWALIVVKAAQAEE